MLALITPNNLPVAINSGYILRNQVKSNFFFSLGSFPYFPNNQLISEFLLESSSLFDFPEELSSLLGFS
nr:MAG TPA: hypothetical protein [Bacteriophage sp.]